MNYIKLKLQAHGRYAGVVGWLVSNMHMINLAKWFKLDLATYLTGRMEIYMEFNLASV